MQVLSILVVKDVFLVCEVTIEDKTLEVPIVVVGIVWQGLQTYWDFVVSISSWGDMMFPEFLPLP